MTVTLIAGQDSNQNAYPAGVDGKALAFSTNGTRPTFRYLAADYVPATAATDVLTLSGVSGKVLRVTKVTVGGVATSASIYDTYIVKRSAANTGGTTTNPTPVKADSLDAGPFGTLTQYSANASTLGTGQVYDGARVYLSAGTAPANSFATKEFIYGNRSDKQPVLRNGEFLAVNFNGQAVPAGTSLYISIEWTEDDA